MMGHRSSILQDCRPWSMFPINCIWPRTLPSERGAVVGMISVFAQEMGPIVNISGISGVVGMRRCRERKGFSAIEHGDSIQKIF